jgi:tryptophan synthase alpha chain
MSRIDAIFEDLRGRSRTALMPFVTAGYPTLDVTRRLIPALQDGGASIVELGIPFSDPIADGPVIAQSMHEALEGGTTPAAVFQLVRELRDGVDMGLIAMVSHSIVQRHGTVRFVEDAAAAGFDGLIVPDIDADRAGDVHDAAAACDMSLSMLVAPTTRSPRLEQLVGLCRGFVYVLARTGITGEQDSAPDVAERVAAIRRISDLPIAVGFGISRPEHVAAVTAHADAAIVGSAIVRRMQDSNDPVAAVRGFVRELAGGLNDQPLATSL